MNVKKIFSSATISILILLFISSVAFSCTTIIAGKNATTDGSLFTSHTNDCGRCDPRIAYVPAKDWEPGAMRAVYKFDLLYPRLCCYDRGPTYLPKAGEVPMEPMGYIPQAAHTYAYYDGVYGIMNEHQLNIGECSCGSRVNGKALPEGEALFDIAELSRVALERCTTAREAIQLMGDLGVEYGYYSGGETLTIIDTEEAWVFNMVGSPDGNGKSAVWVAQRVPDDEVAVMCNQFTVREIDPNDPDTFMFSENIFDLAQTEGWWKPEDGQLDFNRVYGRAYDPVRLYSLRRKWRAFDLLAPSMKFQPYVNDTFTKEYPFSVKPDKKISMADVISITRDYYAGTEFDLSKGIAAGPFGTPNRFAGAGAENLIEGGAWERAISMFRADYTQISQTRGWLPDSIGSVLWYTPDIALTSCFMPIYAGSTHLPESFSTGTRSKYDENSAWWVFNFVSNWADLKFSYMIEDIKIKQQEIEGKEFAFQSAIDAAALVLHKQDPELAKAYLTDYSVNNAEAVVQEWRELGKFLVMKYIDGYVNVPQVGQGVGYPLWWLQEVGFGPLPTEKP